MEREIIHYLHLLKIPVSKRYIEKRIASHPDYPSLLSICDTLEQLGISYSAVRTDKKELENLTFPYVLHISKGAGEFVVIKKESDLKEKQNLLGDWDGIVLKAEPPEAIEDEENLDYLSKEKASRFAVGLFILSVLVMVTVSWVSDFSWATILFSATAIAGTVLGYLLIAKDLGVKYDAVESFCNAGKSANCDRVLRSDEAMLFGRFSLSDAVLSYFSAQLVAAGLLIPAAVNASSLWWALAAASILTLPVVVYSLWLQGAKFKTWCRLCLMVAGVLVLQAGLFGWMAAAGVFGLTDGSLRAGGLLAGLFLATGSLVFLIKTRLKENTKAELEVATANRIKYNPSVFTHLLLQQPQADCTPLEWEFLIGKPEASVKITMAISLGCGPCKEGFEKAKRLIRMYPDQVNLSIRFSIPKQPNGSEIDPARYLLGYWLDRVCGTKHPSEAAKSLLQDWFELADLNRFREKYPLQVNGQSKELETLAVQHSGWFRKANIKGTPTFFINGYQLPGQYRIENLRYLVAGFSEQIPAAGENMKEAKTEQRY